MGGRPDRQRLILTGGEYLGGLAAVRALRAAGYDPWVAVTPEVSYAGLSRAAGGAVAVPKPGDDAEGFARALAAASSRIRAVSVLPGTDGAHLALAEHADLFPAGVALGTCSREIVERAVDKEWLERAAATAGFQTPSTLAMTASEVEQGKADPRYPAVVKPSRSELQVDHRRLRHFGVRRVASRSQLASALRELPDARGLVQPYLQGQIVTVNGVSWEGEVVCAVHQAAERIWPPDCGVLSYAATVPPDAELEEASRQLLGSLGWSGLFNLQLIERDGERYLIDLNPRVYHSLALACGAGVNLPGVWVSLLLGHPVDVNGYRVGVRFRSEAHDLRTLFAAFRDGDRSRALRGLRPRRGTVHAAFSITDPMPMLAELARLRNWLRRRARACGSQLT